QAEGLLRDAFRARQDRLHAARLDLEAALLGRKIAEKAVHVSRTFEQIARIDAEIADLGLRMARLERQAAGNVQKAAGIRLAYAVRLRDLAAARVEGLLQASQDAEEIVRQAQGELNDLAGEFQRVANQIEKAKKRSGFFGVLKAIVSVVGAVLAPFTGGASLTRAALGNTRLDIYPKIDPTKPRNFRQAGAPGRRHARPAGPPGARARA